MGLFQQPSYPQVTTQQQTQQQQLDPAQQNLVDTSAKFLSGQVGQPSQAYTGALTAPLTPAQGTQVQQAVDLGQQSYWPQQQGLGALGAYSSGAYLNNPFLNSQMQAITNQAQQQFAASIPALRAPFVQAGQTGFSSPELSALYGAGASFATDLQKNLLDTASKNYLTEQGYQLQAAPEAVSGGGAVQTMAANQAALPQATQQAQYDAAYKEWLRQLSGSWAATGVPAFGTVATAGAPTSTTSTTTAPPLYGQSPFQSILGGVSNLAPMAMTYMMANKMGYI